jgi:hypothetical protein
MLTAREGHTATLLPNKKVLIVGGASQFLPTGQVALSSAELFDPSTGNFSATGSMDFQRSAHTATLLPDGRVLIAGGYSGDLSQPFSGTALTAELYDPSTGTFTPSGQMAVPRYGHSATLLNSGKVLIAGGEVVGGYTQSTAELYDPVTGLFTLTGSMTALVPDTLQHFLRMAEF